MPGAIAVVPTPSSTAAAAAPSPTTLTATVTPPEPSQPPPAAPSSEAHEQLRRASEPIYHPAASPPQQLRRAQSEQQSVEKTIQVAPGVCIKFRGADETWSCIERDFYMPTMCISCMQELCCIQDADYVICPSCRTVSPMRGMVASTNNNTGHGGGVGLGFTYADLARWQAEIMAKRRG
jgi:hypothetical protein